MNYVIRTQKDIPNFNPEENYDALEIYAKEPLALKLTLYIPVFIYEGVVHVEGCIQKACVHGNSFAVFGALNAAAIEGFGKSRIVALQDANIILHDKASAYCRHMSVIEAHDEARVHASGFANVRAYANSRVTAKERAFVRVYDSSSVALHNYSRAEAFGGARIEAHDNTSVLVKCKPVVVRRYDNAIFTEQYTTWNADFYRENSIQFIDEDTCCMYLLVEKTGSTYHVAGKPDNIVEPGKRYRGATLVPRDTAFEYLCSNTLFCKDEAVTRAAVLRCSVNISELDPGFAFLSGKTNNAFAHRFTVLDEKPFMELAKEIDGEITDAD